VGLFALFLSAITFLLAWLQAKKAGVSKLLDKVSHWFLENIEHRDRRLMALPFLLGLFFLTTFLTHPRSVEIWKLLPFLEYLQFPWRFLALSSFFISFAAGGLLFILRKDRKTILSLFLIIFVVILNFNYFRPERVVKVSDKEKIFSKKNWHKLQTDAIFDYLPKFLPLPPTSPAPEKPFVLDENRGNAVVENFERGTNWMKAKVFAKKDSALVFPSFYFPGWRAWIDRKPKDVSYEKELGRIVLSVPAGEHYLYLRLTNTPLRNWANLLSLVSWWSLLGVILGPKLWKLIPRK
jgi:hypothetical protein